MEENVNVSLSDLIQVIKGDKNSERDFEKKMGIKFLDFLEARPDITPRVVKAAVQKGNREVVETIIRSQKVDAKVFLNALYALPHVGNGVDYDRLMEGEFILRSAHRSMAAQIMVRFKNAGTQDVTAGFETFVKSALHFHQQLWLMALMCQLSDVAELDWFLSYVETSFMKALFKRKQYLPINKLLEPTDDERIRFAAAGVMDNLQRIIQCWEVNLVTDEEGDRKVALESQLLNLKSIQKKHIFCISNLLEVAISSIEEELRAMDEYNEDEEMSDGEFVEEDYKDKEFVPNPSFQFANSADPDNTENNCAFAESSEQYGDGKTD